MLTGFLNESACPTVRPFRRKNQKCLTLMGSDKTTSSSTRLLCPPITHRRNCRHAPNLPPSLPPRESSDDRKYVCCIFVAFQNKRKGYPTTCVREKNLNGIEQKRFYIKGKGYCVFLGQHMTKHSTWDKEGQKGQSPTAASCLFKCHITFTDAMSCDGVEGSHFVLCRLSVPFYTISLHNSPILGHSWYSKR